MQERVLQTIELIEKGALNPDEQGDDSEDDTEDDYASDSPSNSNTIRLRTGNQESRRSSLGVDSTVRRAKRGAGKASSDVEDGDSTIRRPRRPADDDSDENGDEGEPGESYGTMIYNSSDLGTTIINDATMKKAYTASREAERTDEDDVNGSMDELTEDFAQGTILLKSDRGETANDYQPSFLKLLNRPSPERQQKLPSSSFTSSPLPSRKNADPFATMRPSDLYKSTGSVRSGLGGSGQSLNEGQLEGGPVAGMVSDTK